MGCPVGTVKSCTLKEPARVPAAIEYNESPLADGHGAGSRNQP